MTDTKQTWDDLARNLEQLRDRLAPVSRSYVTTVLDQVATLRRATEEREAELTEALAEITPPMPPADATCHKGIVPQERCGHCQRVARALSAAGGGR